MGNRKSRKKEHLKPRPKPGPGIITVNKKRAAVSQLETAILLWFRQGDPISIHALATAAHDCLNAMSSDIGKPSEWETWLRLMPEDVQARALYFQNFIKHGFKDLKGEVEYGIQHGEALIYFAVECYRNSFALLTPLMHLFIARMLIENPAFRSEKGRLQVEKFGLYQSDQIRRQDFLDDLLPVMRAACKRS